MPTQVDTGKQQLEAKMLKIACRDHWAFSKMVCEWFERYGEGQTHASLAELLNQRAPDAHLTSQYIGNCRRVWKAFSSTRRPSLTWTHHLEALRSDPQNAEVWLDKAVKGEWHVSEMLAAIIQTRQPEGALTEVARPRPSEHAPETPDPNTARIMADGFVQEVQSYLDQESLDQDLTNSYLEVVRGLKKHCADLESQLEALL